ncbi:hypothetical protein Pflav_012120 [Phytohabitans flavus]|uniref:Uncharacterized protein n=1 Tax=Phytohabitans flavus TaxID=1076124 RepID=A0A6F8XLV8_9ACTN|nr:hypothetical protein Pflav_012120 [Phytohabitans flavus]
MDIDEARAEVSRIFDAPLEALTEGRRLSVVPGVPEGEWDLPAPDREALWSHGLPPARDDSLYGLVADYQSAREPELVTDGSRLYGIGGSARPGWPRARVRARCWPCRRSHTTKSTRSSSTCFRTACARSC